MPIAAPPSPTEQPKRLKAVGKRLVDSARAVVAENGGSRLAKGVLSDVADNSVTVRIYLTAADKRPLSTSRVVERWRKNTGTIAGLETIRFESNMGGPVRARTSLSCSATMARIPWIRPAKIWRNSSPDFPLYTISTTGRPRENASSTSSCFPWENAWA